MKAYRLIGYWPAKKGNPASRIFTDENLVKEHAKRLGLTYEEIEVEKKSIFYNLIYL